MRCRPMRGTNICPALERGGLSGTKQNRRFANCKLFQEALTKLRASEAQGSSK